MFDPFVTEDRNKTISSMDPRTPSPADILEELVTTLRASLIPNIPPPSASVSPMALPATYTGDAADCGSFLLQIALFIEMQPSMFSTERSKVAFLIYLLSDRVLLWAKAIWNSNTTIINLPKSFRLHGRNTFVVGPSASSAPGCSDHPRI